MATEEVRLLCVTSILPDPPLDGTIWRDSLSDSSLPGYRFKPELSDPED